MGVEVEDAARLVVLEQAEAAGRWFAELPEEDKPEVLLSSPYVRAKQTAEAICAAGGLAGGAKPTVIDERLREREFGVFDGLTTKEAGRLLGVRENTVKTRLHRAKGQLRRSLTESRTTEGWS